jgi:fido (protein-threonine AMPylation protein)
VAWKFEHILDQNRSATDGGCAAHPFAEGNTHAGRLALERPKHKVFAAQEIKSGPIDVWKRVVEERGRIRSIGDGVALACQQRLELLRELPI